MSAVLLQLSAAEFSLFWARVTALLLALLARAALTCSILRFGANPFAPNSQRLELVGQQLTLAAVHSLHSTLQLLWGWFLACAA